MDSHAAPLSKRHLSSDDWDVLLNLGGDDFVFPGDNVLQPAQASAQSSALSGSSHRAATSRKARIEFQTKLGCKASHAMIREPNWGPNDAGPYE